ncbi:DNA-binding response regulator [Brevibacillus fluminis]|uniref:DNA-binding response regulator n=1 Tax=Brevibacillus fluminis TaxID=511487 RepID=A0A3M8D987_9BACL|nr:response regulator transcription factor [Brevibacillus fluminis]RNB84602.1 DNA-binding response regulator [Brevibacillus fluminis]
MTQENDQRKIRVVLVDDQTMIRQGLGYVIKMQPEMEVVGEASDGLEAIELVEKVKPDVILMDVQMPKCSGIEATRQIIRSSPGVKVLILTTFDIQEYVVEGIRAGAVGYMLKDADSLEMLELIRRAYQGEALFRTETAAQALAEVLHSNNTFATDSQNEEYTLLEDLTDREKDVLQQLTYGYRNEQIAQNLFISEGTVKTHVHRILQKMGVDDRTQAVAIALRNKIVQ